MIKTELNRFVCNADWFPLDLHQLSNFLCVATSCGGVLAPDWEMSSNEMKFLPLPSSNDGSGV